MIARFALILGLLLPLSALTEPASAGSAEDWLMRMTKALSTADYEGTLVYLDGEHVETLKVYRSASQERERLVTLSGAHREIVRDGDTLICIGAGVPTVAYEGSPLARWQVAADAVQSGLTPDYALRLLHRERVAGRDAQILALLPQDDLRYGYRVWVDVQSGLPLRIDLVASVPAQASIERLMFSDIVIGRAPAAADLEPSAGAVTQHFSLRSGQEGNADTAGWQVRDLPPGFALRSSTRTADGIQLMYSDGLAGVSVYIESGRSAADPNAAARAGAVHARSFNVGDYRVYVIGKVPAQTVERVARSVVRAG